MKIEITINDCRSQGLSPPAWALELLAAIKKLETKMALDFSGLEHELADNSSAVDSALVLITALRDEIAAAGGDQEKLNALVASLDERSAALAAAVVAVPPAAPTP